MFVPSLEPPPCGGRNSPSARVEAVGTARCGARPTSALPRRCCGLQLRHTAVALFYRGGGFLFVGAGHWPARNAAGCGQSALRSKQNPKSTAAAGGVMK